MSYISSMVIIKIINYQIIMVIRERYIVELGVVLETSVRDNKGVTFTPVT